MFTIHQIHQASSKVKSGADFPRLVQDLKSIGVDYYIRQIKNESADFFKE